MNKRKQQPKQSFLRTQYAMMSASDAKERAKWLHTELAAVPISLITQQAIVENHTIRIPVFRAEAKHAHAVTVQVKKAKQYTYGKQDYKVCIWQHRTH